MGKIKTKKKGKKQKKNGKKMGKKTKKKKERTAQHFTVDLHSETLSSFSFFLMVIIRKKIVI
jgi:hypothetical protein